MSSQSVSKKRAHSEASSSASENEDEISALLTGSRRSVTLRNSPASPPTSKRTRSASTTSTLRDSAGPATPPLIAPVRTAVKPRFDPNHHSNVRAVAGGSGLGRARPPQQDLPPPRRRPPTTRTPSQNQKSINRSAREVSVIVISDSDEGTPRPAEFPARRQTSATVDAGRDATPAVKKKHKRPRFSERSDDEDEEDFARHRRAIRRLLDKERAEQIRKSNEGRETDDLPQYNGPSATDESSAPAAGSLLEVTLRHFMCHKYFTITFGRFNFVQGANGSGKSAVLAALQLTLGARAVNTGRGTAIADFIGKHGDSAHIAVTLSNSGEASYRPSVFGSKVVVQRTIRKGGSSSFKVLDADGKVVGDTAGFVAQLTSAFGIRIDSPLTLLTQDQSRIFIKNASPTERYKLWLIGTGLVELSTNLTELEKNIDSMAHHLSNARPDVVDMRKAEQDCKKVVKEAQGVEKVREELKAAEDQLAWRVVQDHERDLTRLGNDLHRARLDLETYQNGMRERERQAEQDAADLRAAESKKEQLEQDSQEVASLLDEVTKRQQQKRREVNDVKNSIRTVKNDIAGHVREFAEASQQIEQLQEESQHQDERIMTAQAEVDRLEARQEELREKIAGADEVVADLQSQIRDPRDNPNLDRIETIDRDLRRATTDLAQAKAAKVDPVAVYGPDMRRFLHAIEAARQQRQFTDEVDGPIGAYITVKDPRWQKVCETLLGSSLSAFVVLNERDQETLMRLRKQFGGLRNVSIIRRRRDPTWALPEERQPDQRYMTLLRAITFERARHEEAFRTIIDKHSPESIILVGDSTDDRHRAENLMLTNDSRQSFIARCVNASAFEIRAQDGKRSMMALGNIHPNQYRLTLSNGSNNRQQQITNLERDVTRLQADLDTATQLGRAWLQADQQRIQGLQRRVRDRQSDRARWSTELKECSREILEHRAVLDEDSPAALEALKDEAKAAEAARTAAQSQLDASIELQDKIVRELEALDQLVQTRQESVEKVWEKLEKVLADVQTLSQTQAESQSELNQVTRTLNKLQTKVAAALEKVEVSQRTLEDSLAKAAERGMRQRVDGTSQADLQRRCGRLGAQLAEAAGRPAVDLVAAEDAYLAARERVDHAVTQLNDLRYLLKSLRIALVERQKRWHKMRDGCKQRAKSDFTKLMADRQIAARLEFNFQKDTLDIEVDWGHDGKKQASKIELSQRSGGERSITQIYFLMSLWSGVESPFRALDEFSVFLDPANDAIAQEALVRYGLQYGPQFIILTPLDLRLPEKLKRQIKIVQLKKQ